MASKATKGAVDPNKSGIGTSEEVTPADGVRVVCSRPNAGALISGVLFADVVIDENAPIHISAQISADQAARFLRIGGYEIWTGDEEANGRVIADALEASEKSLIRSEGKSPESEDLKRQLEEQRSSNLNLSARIVEQSERIQALEAENAALRGASTGGAQ